MSSAGTRSVTTTTSGISASIASTMALAAFCGGTKTMLAFACVSSTAFATVSKIGRLRCERPPLPGVTPATTAVPYSIMRAV